MGLGNLFKLSKLTITAYKTSARGATDLIGKPLEVQYNPSTLAIKHESVFQGRSGIATSSSTAKYSHSRSPTLDVSLVFDGTNAGYMGVELLFGVESVADRVKKFLRTCYQVESTTHEPAFLRLTWDQGVLGPNFDCRLKSVDIQYTSFDRDGSPLHAELAVSFLADIAPGKKAALDRLSSPDLSHRRVVCSGDTLPLLCREIYGSAEHYLRVAEVNGLDDIRVLQPGTELVFPPYEGARRPSRRQGGR
jgi:hypothetical protein